MEIKIPTRFANPSQLIGLSANNGTLSTALRSDSTPALNQAIAPTWTDLHTFNRGISPLTSIFLDMNVPGSNGQRDSHNITLRGTSYDGTGHTSDWKLFVDVVNDDGTSLFSLGNDQDGGGFSSLLTVDNTGLTTAFQFMASDVGLVTLPAIQVGRSNLGLYSELDYIIPGHDILKFAVNGTNVATLDWSGNLNVLSDIYAVSVSATSQLKSTLSTGTNPIDVVSTTVCPNLNADMVDGFHAASFQGVDSTLTSLAGYNTNGLLTQTAADTFTGRTITQASANQVIVTNGDGVAGNPTLSLPQNIHTAATPTFQSMTLSHTAPSLVFTDTTGSAKSLTILVDGNSANFRESAGAASSLMVLDLSNNRLGVGIAPTQPLEVSLSSSGAVGGIMQVTNPTTAASSAVEIRMAPSSAPTIRYASIQAINDGSNNIDLSFLTGAGASITEKLRILSNGNVGVGLSPSQKFHVGGTGTITTRVSSSTATSGRAITQFAVDTVLWDFGANADGSNTGSFMFRENGTNRLVLIAGGNIALNTSTFGTGATFNFALGGGATSPVLGAAAADVVQLAAVDKSAGNRRLYIQSEVGSPINLGNDTLEFAAAATIVSPTYVRIDNLYGIITTDADGATVTFNIATSNKHIVTLGGNRILAVSNDNDGQGFTIILKQDGTGGRTVTWWSGIQWVGGVTPTLTTTGGKYDMFSFIRLSSGVYLGMSSLNF